MTQEQIEGNGLIAEFRGWEYLSDFNYPENNKVGWYDSNGNYLGLVLNFHSSWDMLMPVVEKIERLKYVDEFEIKWDSVYGKQMCCILPALKETFNVIIFSATSKIEAVWQAVVNFITWYNENK